MATSDYLDITLLEEGQSQKEAAVNAAIDVLCTASAGLLIHDMASDADYTLDTGTDEDDYLALRITDIGVVLTTGRNIIVPAREQLRMMENLTAQNLTLKTAAGSGITVGADGKHLIYCDGTDCVDLGFAGSGDLAFTDLSDAPASYSGKGSYTVKVNAGEDALEFVDVATPVTAFTGLSDVPAAYTGAGGYTVKVNVGEDALEFVDVAASVTAFTGLSDVPGNYTDDGGKIVQVNSGETALEFVAPAYRVGAFVPGVPTASLICMLHVAADAVDLPSGLTGSQGYAKTAATAQTDFDIQKNGSSVGTMRFAVSGTTASFIAASPITLAAGDRLEVIAPASPDATLANITFTLVGTR